MQSRLIGEGFDADAEPRAHDPPASHQFRADRLGDLRRDGETEAAIQTVDQRVHADDLAIQINQRTAAVARIDGSIGLQVVLVNRAPQIAPPFAADHADGERVVQLEGRTDHADKFPHPRTFAVAPGDRLEPGGLGLEHGQIRFVIHPDHLQRQTRSVLEPRDDTRLRIRAVDHVGIGQDVTLVGNDEARALAFLLPRDLRSTGL